MRKKRILFCTESTFLHTGYATYSREILRYLHGTGKYEIAELGAYGTNDDPRATETPWKYYGVIPNTNDQERINKYKANATAQFGGFAFENTCLNFKPDIVCDIRDFWMIDFIDKSPYRKFFKWVLMPTVDAYPQAREWIDTFSRTDVCLSYSDWSGDVLNEQSGGKINYIGSAPPSAHPEYKPKNKEELKVKYGIDKNTKIIGTVMRNQRRKLYPDLFKAYSKFLESVEDPEKHMLYCHTCFPDAGWNIPELLHENNIISKVLFTYVCADTFKPFVSTFKGSTTTSPYTGKYNARMASVKQGLGYEELSEIMNMFDLYVQYANSEGFGLPQVEAAACGVPVASIKYSAMESVIKQLDGFAINPKALYKEMETGCERAVPDNEHACQIFLEFFNKTTSEREKASKDIRNNFLKEFTWEKSGAKWEEAFDSLEIIPEQETWFSAPDIKKPLEFQEEIKQQPLDVIAKWLVAEVLHQPEKINSFFYADLLESLNYGYQTSQIIGSYFNEDDSAVSMGRKIEHNKVTIESAYEECKEKRKIINIWEQVRREKFKL